MTGEPSAELRVCATSDLPPGEAIRVPGQPPIAVFNLDGEFYATADWCTHEEASLSEEGFVDGDRVECGWHGARFCIRTGAVEALPAKQPLATYGVRVRDGEVYVAMPPGAG